MKWGVEHVETVRPVQQLRLLGSVGEPINPKAWLWYHEVIGGERCPIVDTWWQTETGAIMVTPLPGDRLHQARLSHPAVPGIAAEVVDERDGEPIDEGQGLLVLTRPWPSMLRTLYKEDDRFIETYFARFGKDTYLVGDAARDKDGYFWVIGRIDDVINVSGHRLSTAEVESAIVSHGKVAEAAVIGQVDEDSGQAICAFVTLEGDLEGTNELVEEIRSPRGRPDRQVRAAEADHLGRRPPQDPLREDHAPTAQDIADGKALGEYATLRDPDVMAQLEGKIKEEQAAE